EKSVEAGTAFIATVDTWAEGAYNAVINWVNQIPNAVGNAISNAGQSVAGFWNSIKSNFSAGMSAGENKGLPGHADGGIFNKAHIAWFAEGKSPEAAIPINNSSRSISLLEKTNQLMGNPLGVGRGSVSIHAPFSPSIVVQGGDSNVMESVKQMLDGYLNNYEARLENIVDRLSAQRERVAF
ncbi:MAG: hypothetical protein ACRDBM_16370, partial [Sporomusa sp.]